MTQKELFADMERAIEVKDGNDIKTHIGLTVCEGPLTYRLMLTRPYQEEGRIIEIPIESIESISDVGWGPLGEAPEIESSNDSREIESSND
jgi:hypothetical protein